MIKHKDCPNEHCTCCDEHESLNCRSKHSNMADTKPLKEVINHPQHYGGDTTYEAIKVIKAWDLGFCLGNAVKYICRAGKKDPAKELEDLKKAAWYLNERIKELESNEITRTTQEYADSRPRNSPSRTLEP